MWQTGQSPIPGYKLEKFLGRGNFGEVWQATSPGGTKCALKFLNLRERQGRKELRAIQRLKQIRHANLMPFNAMWLLDELQRIVPDAHLDSSHPFMEDTSRQTLVSMPQIPQEDAPKTLVIAMPVAEGNLLELLRERQEHGQGIPVDELLVYMMDAARALDYLNSQRHEYGGEIVAVQHGDVKPENLVLLGGSVMLCDFGVARTLGAGSNSRGTTLGGSLAYMAPECMAGESSPQSDQFSLAISYVELRTGQLPFPDESMSQVIEDRRKGQLNLTGLLPAEERVIRRACSVNPDKRFPSNVALIEALRTAVMGTTPTSKKSPWLALATVATIFLAVGLAIRATFFPPIKTLVADLPPTKSGKQYYAEPIAVVQAPNVSSVQLAEATNLYLSALDNDFQAEVPAPQRMGIQDDLVREQLYPVVERRQLNHLIAVHPQTLRIFTVGDNGRSLVEVGANVQDNRIPLELAAPVASIYWLDQSHLLIGDTQTNLWKINVESRELEQVATGVLRVVSSPKSKMALSASDDDGSGASALLQVRAGNLQNVPLPPDRTTMISPLLAIDPAGEWGAVLEDLEKAGTTVLLPLGSIDAPHIAPVDTRIEPYCCTCLRLGTECLMIVAGASPEHTSDFAILQLRQSDSSATVTYPTATTQQSLFEGSERFVRSLTTFVAADESSALLATGQDATAGSPLTELWRIQPNATASFEGIVGLETQAPSISALAFDATGEWLVRGTSWGEVRLTKLSDPQLDFQLMTEDYGETVIQIEIVDGKIIAAFADATVLIWNFYECEMVYDAHVSKDAPLPTIVHARSQAG